MVPYHKQNSVEGPGQNKLKEAVSRLAGYVARDVTKLTTEIATNLSDLGKSSSPTETPETQTVETLLTQQSAHSDFLLFVRLINTLTYLLTYLPCSVRPGAKLLVRTSPYHSLNRAQQPHHASTQTKRHMSFTNTNPKHCTYS